MIPLIFFSIVPGTLPSEALPSGPPAPHLDRTPHVQLQLQQHSAWQQFQDDWGEGWGIRWDERTATPRFLYVPGVSTRNERELVQSVAELAGIPNKCARLTCPVLAALFASLPTTFVSACVLHEAGPDELTTT